MEKKNVLYALFLVGLMMVFSWMVWAAVDNDLQYSATNITSPTNGTNYSGTLLLNLTIDNGTCFANATNVTYAFYDADGALAYNVSLYPRVNETDPKLYNFTSVGTWYDWSNVTYNMTIEERDNYWESFNKDI